MSSQTHPLACPPPRPGDTVVHLDYGLCRLGGLQRMDLSDGPVCTIELAFKDAETRHVPVADAVRIWNYGADLPDAKLDPVGGSDWAARQAVRITELQDAFAQLQARRDARLDRAGHELEVKSQLDAAGAGFPHTLTDCQSRALAEIADDLAKTTPTNRLLIGDVGCGKTEVALRLALGTALAGQRARLVAPTRVLARQHFADIRERAETLGLKVALYSGDLSAAEKRDVVNGAEDIDLIIGTHAVLGERFADVPFGLTIIDEEQKFGAKLKRAGFSADTGGNTLRLSATPIPATIAEARVGLAELSLIHSYPSGRGRTRTRHCPMTDAALRDAVEAEFDRDGQVMIMAPRISDLKDMGPLLRKLFPDHRFGIVHGQRKAKRNRKTLQRLRQGKRDGVLATTVLETGVNLPRANTMVVVRPERFGLAQLHQLRGRIGRGERNAHFVILHGEDSEADADSAVTTTDSFKRRMDVLSTLQERGDGLALALADAMLRGSGKLDDTDQSGHASAVGLELFDHLLQRAESGENPFRLIPKIVGDADWDLPADADEALAAAFNGSRSALDGTPGPDRLSQLIARCRTLGADNATVTENGVIFSRSGDRLSEAADLSAALQD